MFEDRVNIVAFIKDLCAVKNGLKNLHCNPDGQIVGAAELIKAGKSVVEIAEECIGEQIMEKLKYPTEVSIEVEEQIEVDDFKSLGWSEHYADDLNMEVNVELCYEDTIAVEVKLEYRDESPIGAETLEVVVDGSYGGVDEAAKDLSELIRDYIEGEGYDIKY